MAAFWEAGPRDADENQLKGDVLSIATRISLVQSNHFQIATMGAEDLLVNETKDAVLVANRDQSQQVKALAKQLQPAGRGEFVDHPRVSRPWRHYDSIDWGSHYQVKRICVMPDERLCTTTAPSTESKIVMAAFHPDSGLS